VPLARRKCLCSFKKTAQNPAGYAQRLGTHVVDMLNYLNELDTICQAVTKEYKPDYRIGLSK
jgi:hypothetical protein